MNLHPSILYSWYRIIRQIAEFDMNPMVPSDSLSLTCVLNCIMRHRIIVENRLIRHILLGPAKSLSTIYSSYNSTYSVKNQNSWAASEHFYAVCHHAFCCFSSCLHSITLYVGFVSNQSGRVWPEERKIAKFDVFAWNNWNIDLYDNFIIRQIV